MSDINQVTLKGRLSDAPEVRIVGKNDTEMAKLTIATHRIVGEKEITEWNRCVAWGFNASKCRDLKSGDTVLAVGELRTSSWEAEDGNKRYRTEINLEEIGLVRSLGEREAGDGPPSNPTMGPPAPKPRGSSYPFDDHKNGLVWQDPDDGFSFTTDNGVNYCAEWHNVSNPRLGGLLHKHNGSDWVVVGEVPVDADVPI